MGEDMADGADAAGAAVRARRSTRCRAAPPCRRAGPWPGGAPATPGRRARSTRRCRSRCGRCRRGLARREGSRARRWRRRAQSAAAGTRRSAVAAAGRWSRRGPSSPGRNRRADRPASSPGPGARSRRACGRSSRAAGRSTRSTLVSTAGGSLAERDRGDRRRGVGADARQLREARRRVAGKPPRARHFAGAGDEVAGAGIIAEARPFGEDRPRRSPRPAPRSSASARRTARTAESTVGDRRLLEHDLAQPHAIGIGRRRARRRTPRQAPEVIHIMLDAGASAALAVTMPLWHARGAMSKQKARQ